MALNNTRNILAHCSPLNSYKLLLASAVITRSQLKYVWMALLKPFIRDGHLQATYRCYDRTLTVRLRLSDLGSDIRGIWELGVFDTYEIDPAFAPDLVIDAGGNMGLFTLRMAAATAAQNCPAQFIIVEPLPANVELIQLHLRMNQLQADIQPVCMGGAQRTVPFYCREAIRSSFDPREAYTSVIDIKVLTLHDVIGQRHPSRILIKLDIEGMELETLRAYVPTEKRAVYIVGECHDYAGEAPQIEALFHQYGWTVEFYEIHDGYANFRACSPSALPLIPSFAERTAQSVIS